MNLQFHMMVNRVAGWVNRHQQAVIEYLTEEKQILIEQLGGTKTFTNAQRLRLARKQMLWEEELFLVFPLW